MTQAHYRESVRAPLGVLLGQAIALGLLVAGLITWMSRLTPGTGSEPLTNFASVFPIAAGLSALILWLSQRTTIAIQDTQQFSGGKAATLVVRGGPQAQKQYVPLSCIDTLHNISFTGPWWSLSMQGLPAEPVPEGRATWWQTFFALRRTGDTIPVNNKSVRGYRGEGLLVTYRAPTLTSGGDEHRWRILFPTRNANELKKLLTP